MAFRVEVYNEGDDTPHGNPEETHQYEYLERALFKLISLAMDRYRIDRINFWTTAGPNSTAHEIFAVYEPGQPGNIVLRKTED